jgi:hypothetical protein
LCGCRTLSARERETLKTALEGLGDEPRIVDQAEPWVVRGLRTTVIGSGLIDLLDDRSLRSVLVQASLLDRSAVAAELVVWLAILPLKAAWHVNGWIGQLGRLLAVVVGTTLVVPMVIWRTGYARWAGRLFAAMLGGMLSTLMLTSGMTLLAALLMTSWVIVPAMRAVLAWEWRRVERRADEAVMRMGLGWELVGALEELLWLEPQPVPPGLVDLFYRVGLPVRERLDRVWLALSETPRHGEISHTDGASARADEPVGPASRQVH